MELCGAVCLCLANSMNKNEGVNLGRKKAAQEKRVVTCCQQVVVKGKKQCQGCGARIGEDYIERQSYQVGDYKICDHCLKDLKHRGRLWVAPYGQHLVLYPDGKVLVERIFELDKQSDVEDEL